MRTACLVSLQVRIRTSPNASPENAGVFVGSDPTNSVTAPCLVMQLSITTACNQQFTHTRALFHTDTFPHRRFYTQTLFFQNRPFSTQTLLHTNTFTHRRFYIHTHTDPFTQRGFYTDTTMLLHTDAFTLRPF